MSTQRFPQDLSASRSADTYIPIRGVFESTLACNLKCRHCGSSAGKARPDELTTEECAILFRDLKALGMERLTISGGEPTTRADWQALIALCTEVGLSVGMFTNAVTLSSDDICIAKSNGLASLAFSVDGLNSTHDRIRGRSGHFKVLENAMKNCVRLNMPFCVVTTLCNDNIAQLHSLHKWIGQMGAYAWQVQPGVHMGNMKVHSEMLLTPKLLPRVEQTIAELMVSHSLKIVVGDSLGYFGPNEKVIRSNCNGFGGCGAGKRNIGIECNGNIKGCLSIMAGYNAEGDKWVEGNIRETPLTELWHRPGAFKTTRQWTRKQLTGFCASCAYAERCRGGCLGQQISEGTLGETRMCTYRVLMESSRSPHHIAKAASIFFAASLAGTALEGCFELRPVYGAPPSHIEDDADTVAIYSAPDTDYDTSDSDSATDSDTDDTDTGDTNADSTTDNDTEMNQVVYGFPATACFEEEAADGQQACVPWATSADGPCADDYDACRKDAKCAPLEDAVDNTWDYDDWAPRQDILFENAGEDAVDKYTDGRID